MLLLAINQQWNNSLISSSITPFVERFQREQIQRNGSFNNARNKNYLYHQCQYMYLTNCSVKFQIILTHLSLISFWCKKKMYKSSYTLKILLNSTSNLRWKLKQFFQQIKLPHTKKRDLQPHVHVEKTHKSEIKIPLVFSLGIYRSCNDLRRLWILFVGVEWICLVRL